jgi:hypothetical protein
MSGYYRKYIHNYAKITEPRTNLTRKDVPFNFNDSCKDAFNYLKQKFQEAPILRQFDPERPIILFTDASGFALGAILSQKDSTGCEFVSSFASRLLKGVELHYVTDHKAYHWLMTINDPTGRLARWAIYIQAYTFDIILKIW